MQILDVWLLNLRSACRIWKLLYTSLQHSLLLLQMCRFPWKYLLWVSVKPSACGRFSSAIHEILSLIWNVVLCAVKVYLTFLSWTTDLEVRHDWYVVVSEVKIKIVLFAIINNENRWLSLRESISAKRKYILSKNIFSKWYFTLLNRVIIGMLW